MIRSTAFRAARCASAILLASVAASGLSGCAFFKALQQQPVAAQPSLQAPAPSPNRSEERRKVAGMVSAEAKRQGLPEPLGLAVARQESNFNPRALSDQGAMGVMQVLPATARSLGFKGPVADLFKPEVNIPLGITYLKQGYDEGGAKWAALRYHGGPDTRIHGPKTRRYAAVVLAMAGMDANGWIARGTTKIAMAEVRSWSSFN